MIETATEFTIKARRFGENRHDVLISGHRKPVTRMEKVRVDRDGHRINTNLLRVKVGPEFKSTIGFVGEGKAYDPDRQQVGYSSVDPDITIWPEQPGIFEQTYLGTLSRQVSSKKVGSLTRVLRKTPGLGALMRDCAPLSIHYSSPESPGFTINIPRGVSRHCDVSVHDDRINRIQLLSTYLYEQRRGVALDIAMAPFVLLIHILNSFLNVLDFFSD